MKGGKEALGGVCDESPRSYPLLLCAVSSTLVSVCALHAEVVFTCVRTEVYEAFGNLNGALCLGLRLNGSATLKGVCKMPLHVIIFDH